MSVPDLYLSPDQRDLLQVALDSNRHNPTSISPAIPPVTNPQSSTMSEQTAPGSGHLDFSDDSPYLDFGLDGDGDDSFAYTNEDGQMIGDLPDDGGASVADLHDKRKSIDGQDEDDEGGGKRREGDDKSGRKPGRKPLTSEPTSKRKAQNRAAQRAFRDRKEKHLKDLETKVDELEKASESKNHENGLLKAQVERLQIELREYRKRLSWIANGNTRAPSSTSTQGRNSLGGGNDFSFEFPKFGDLPSANFKTASVQNQQPPKQRQRPTQNSAQTPAATSQTHTSPSYSATSPAGSFVPRQSSSSITSATAGSQAGSIGNSPGANTYTTSPAPMASFVSPKPQTQGSVDSLSGLFSPSILQATSRSNSLSYFPDSATARAPSGTRSSLDVTAVPGLVTSSSNSNTESPASSAEMNQHSSSSIGTSPEPLFNSPGNSKTDFNLAAIDENNPMTNIFGASSGNDELFASSIDWLAQQNGGHFDPVLFGDYRETQDNVLSQDFGSFFNDAYPLPDLGSPTHNFGDVAVAAAPAAAADTTNSRPDLIRQVDAAQEGEVVPADRGNMLTCNKIWDRLQSMEKFRNGEIDIDNLCSELRAKAKCSEGGAVVEEKHVNHLLGGNKR